LALAANSLWQKRVQSTLRSSWKRAGSYRRPTAPFAVRSRSKRMVSTLDKDAHRIRECSPPSPLRRLEMNRISRRPIGSWVRLLEGPQIAGGTLTSSET
jgi:hypothetical protein